MSTPALVRPLSHAGQNVIGYACSAATAGGGSYVFNGIGELAEFGNTCVLKRTTYSDGLMDSALKSCSAEAAPWMFDSDVVQSIERVDVAAIPHCAVTLKPNLDGSKYAKYDEKVRLEAVTRSDTYRKYKALYDALLIEHEEAKRTRVLRRQDRDAALVRLNKLLDDMADAEAQQRALEAANDVAQRAVDARKKKLADTKTRIHELNRQIGDATDVNNELLVDIKNAKAKTEALLRDTAEYSRKTEAAVNKKTYYDEVFAEYERLNNVVEQDINRAGKAVPKECADFNLDADLWNTCANGRGVSSSDETRNMMEGVSPEACSEACWKDRGCMSFFHSGEPSGTCFLYARPFGQGQTWREPTDADGITAIKTKPRQPDVVHGCENNTPSFSCPSKRSVITGGHFVYGRWIPRPHCDGNRANKTGRAQSHSIDRFGGCIGSPSCAIHGSLNNIAGDPFKGVYKHWAGQVTCEEA